MCLDEDSGPIKCYQCGGEDAMPCGEDASPDNLKECSSEHKFCYFLMATLGKLLR